MFGQIPETPYDLRFNVAGIPTRVHPGFWIIAAIVTWYPGNLGIVLVGISCVFVSILIHELGHALLARQFGWPPNIVLYYFGGLAYYTPTWGQTRGKSIAISLAGPGAGFLLYGLVRGLRYYYQMNHPGIFESYYVSSAFFFLEFLNLWWGILNLLPIFPLDGGRVAQEIFQGINYSRGLEWTF
ncbi:MAG TPA: site-2 protease family protein, partial [Planctomycetaceae bacterium]|nr:site-2 protease family protein [Planctomycetaceae bacterium]